MTQVGLERMTQLGLERMLRNLKLSEDDNKDRAVIYLIGCGFHLCIGEFDAFNFNPANQERSHVNLSRAIQITRRYGIDAKGVRIDKELAKRYHFYIMCEQARERDGQILGADEEGYPLGYAVWRMVQ